MSPYLIISIAGLVCILTSYTRLAPEFENQVFRVAAKGIFASKKYFSLIGWRLYLAGLILVGVGGVLAIFLG